MKTQWTWADHETRNTFIEFASPCRHTVISFLLTLGRLVSLGTLSRWCHRIGFYGKNLQGFPLFSHRTIHGFQTELSRFASPDLHGEPVGRRLIFHFAENPYFTNSAFAWQPAGGFWNRGHEHWLQGNQGLEKCYKMLYTYWLLVSNMTFIYHKLMGCHPSHWRTYIFQDGYCTTNQYNMSWFAAWIIEESWRIQEISGMSQESKFVQTTMS